MMAETTWQMYCPKIQKDVQITELCYVESGGSCQIDINAGEKSCAEQCTCPAQHKSDCLLLL